MFSLSGVVYTLEVIEKPVNLKNVPVKDITEFYSMKKRETASQVKLKSKRLNSRATTILNLCK